MASSPIIEQGKQTMTKAIQHLKQDLATIRTGRAQTSLVENILIESYGTKTPLKSLSSISIPESNQLVIQPWDKNILKNIESALRDSNLGINPINDGSVIRIVLSPPTEEKRKELVKVVHRMAEEARIAIRNARQHAHSALKQAQKDTQITEDDFFLLEKELQHVVDGYNSQIESVTKSKEHDVMSL